MNDRTRICIVLFLLLTAGMSLAQSSVRTKSGLVITDLTFGPTTWRMGYIERRFLIENTLPLQRTVFLELPGSLAAYPEGSLSLAGTVTLEAQSKVVLSLPQPRLRLAGTHEIGITLKGGTKEKVELFLPQFKDYNPNRLPSILLSKSLSAEAMRDQLIVNAEKFEASIPEEKRQRRATERLFSKERMKDMSLFRFEREPSAWSPNWLAYTGFDGCVVTAEDYARMPEEIRTALREYVAAGGQLTVLGMSRIPAGWDWTYGYKEAQTTSDGIISCRYGFGLVQAFENGDIQKITPKQYAELVSTWSTSDNLLFEQDEVSLIDRGYNRYYSHQIPVKNGLQVPISLFLFILLAFALITGPGVVIYTSRTNRRIWQLWLVPSLSITFSIAIFVFALLSEGITPSIHRQAVTLLDQSRHQAVTLGAVGIYAPLSVSDGLQFDRNTEVSPLSYNMAETNVRVVWGQRQHFTTGWVLPRMPAYFHMQRSETRSERLIVTESTPGGVEVVNMLGVPIRKLTLCDSQERIYEALNVQPGEKRALTSSRKKAKEARATEQRPLRKELPKDIIQNIEYLAKMWAHENVSESIPLEVKSYKAVLEGCPFTENPLAYGANKESTTAIVIGAY